MGNLIRPVNKYLLNSVAAGTTDVAALTDAKTGRKVFVHKGLGLAIPGNLSGENPPRIKVNIMPGVAGTKKKVTLELKRLFNTSNTSDEFIFSVIRKPAFDGFTHEVNEVKHIYNYEKTNFSTPSNGAYNATDTADILETLVDRINADKQIGPNHVLTGAVVNATYVAAVTTSGSEAPAYITLESKDAGVDFSVEVNSEYFELNSIDDVPVAGVKTRGSAEEIARIFPLRADQQGTMPVLPVKGTLYTLIEIRERSEGYDNVVASGYNTREQITQIYVPNADADALADPLVAKLKEAALTVYKNGVAWT